MRMCTGVPEQHSAPLFGAQLSGAGAKRRCEASRHSTGLRRQQPDAHPHVCLPSCGVASFRGGLVEWVALVGLQLVASGWRTQQELSGVHAVPPTKGSSSGSKTRAILQKFWGGAAPYKIYKISRPKK